MVKILGFGVAVILIGFTVLTLWRVQQNARTAAREFPAPGTFVDVDGHPVHYVEMGQKAGTAPDLVLIHGASGNTRDMTFSLATQLAPDYRLVIFDRPGLGHTPALGPKGVSISDQARLLSAAATAIGVETPIVAGQSFGGAVTMAWAVNHPDTISAAMLMAGATHPWEGPRDAFSARLAHPIFGPIVARLISAWAPQDYVKASIESIFEPQNAPEGYGEAVGVPLVLRPATLIANAQQRDDLREEVRALHTKYPDLTLPIEIVHGDADTIVGLSVHSERMVAEVASARLTVLPGVGHMPQHVSHPEVIAAIERAAVRAGLR